MSLVKGPMTYTHTVTSRSFCDTTRKLFQIIYCVSINKKGADLFRDTLNKKIRSFLVYRYTCSNCNANCYGKTYCHIFTRAVEHMGVSNLTGKQLKNIKDSAVSDHLLQCDYNIDFDHFDILVTDVDNLIIQ